MDHTKQKYFCNKPRLPSSFFFIINLILVMLIAQNVQTQLELPGSNNYFYSYQNSQRRAIQSLSNPNPYTRNVQENLESPYQNLNSFYTQQQNSFQNTDFNQTQHQLSSPPFTQLPYQNQRLISSVGVPSKVLRGGFSVKNGSYILEWEVIHPTITFKASRKGIGFVGFAISPSGGMSGADIFIAGIGPTGMPFANDYHHEYQPGGVGSAVPDVSNDYQLLDISESQGSTTAKFRRLLDTQDLSEDHPIQNTEQNILWSIGPSSRGLEYHGPNNRGVVKINLLDPPAKFRIQRPI